MKTNTFKLLTPIFILFLYGSNCKKEKEPTVAHISQEAKDFCVFEKGTWWEYENINTMQIDTWKVTSLENKISASSYNSVGNQEYIFIDITTNIHDTFTFRINTQNFKFETNKHWGIMQVLYFEDNKTINGCNNNQSFLLSTDSLNNICIKKEFQLLPFPCTNFFPNKATWQRNIGIAAMTYPNGDSLILKSYNVIQ